jgi:hypothetical protein
MAASLLVNSGVPNATPPETRTEAKNQAESELAKLLFFNSPNEFLTLAIRLGVAVMVPELSAARSPVRWLEGSVISKCGRG